MKHYAYERAGLQVDEGLRAYMLRVYNYLCAGLALSAATCFAAINVDLIRNALFSSDFYGNVSMTGLGLVVSLAPIGICLYFFFRQNAMSVEKARLFFWLYAALSGMSLAPVGLSYTGESLATTLCVCASVFGVMSIYGNTTKRDLTSLGSFLIMGIWGLVVASICSLVFSASPVVNFISSVLGVLIFTGITAYDTQKIKSYYYMAGDGMESRMAIVGAFILYLDVVNLFLHMLRFFGVSRRND